MNNELPFMPYAGTSGWSGSDTSELRARSEDANGTTAKRQRIVLDYARQQQSLGITWKDLADLFGWHHGQASGALSVLHKAGELDRLAETRSRCKVYVLPRYVNDRPTEPHKSNRPHVCPNCGTDL